MSTVGGHGAAARFPDLAAQSPVESVDQPSWRRRRERHVAGVALIGLWAVWVAAAGWGGPWKSTPEALVADIDSGSVVQWSLSTQSPPDPLTRSGYLVGSGHAMTSQSSSSATIVQWRDRSHRSHWTDARTLAAALPDGTPSDGTPTVQPAAENALRAWLSERTQGTLATSYVLWWNIAGGLFWAVGFLLIVFGPAPRRGNRWYWFWVGGLALGVGLVAYAVAECLIDRPQRRRRLGGWGFCTVLIATPVVGAAGALALGTLGAV